MSRRACDPGQPPPRPGRRRGRGRRRWPGCAASSRPPHDAAGWSPDQPVRRRRAHEPRAASKTTAGPLPGRPRSSRFPPAITLLARTQFVQVDVRGRHNSSISPVSGRDFWPPHAEFCTRAVVAARSRPWCRTRRGQTMAAMTSRRATRTTGPRATGIRTASPASPDKTVRSRWLPSKRDRTGS